MAMPTHKSCNPIRVGPLRYPPSPHLENVMQVTNLTRAQLRAFKHDAKAKQFAAAGLNGKRAVARRQRQVATGSLRGENGLVA
jgi:hypothetical protein